MKNFLYTATIVILLASCKKEEVARPEYKKISFEVIQDENYTSEVKPDMQLRIIMSRRNNSTGFTTTILDTLMLSAQLRRIPVLPGKLQIDTTIQTNPNTETLYYSYTYASRKSGIMQAKSIEELIPRNVTEKRVQIELD